VNILSEQAILIYIANFGASIISGAIGMGGGIALVAALGSILPTPAIIPVHSTLVIGQTTQRAVLLRKSINKGLLYQLIIGVVIGVAIGSQLNVSMPEHVYKTALGVLLLSIVWMPKFKMPFKIPLFVGGTIHAIISTTFGPGGILQGVFSRIGLKKKEIVATFGATMAILNILKATAFGLLGFSFYEYLPVIGIAYVTGFIGTYIGQHILHRISEEKFKLAFKVGITLLALRMLYSVL
jgi:uncharacterized membrane protein YfcA